MKEYTYVCPECDGGFNYPAKFTTSIPPFVYDGCPLCGHSLEPIGIEYMQGQEYMFSTIEAEI